MSTNIEIIREWIQKEKFFGRTDEHFIARYLKFCNDDVEKTKQRIVRYYELRRQYPRLMRKRDFLEEKYTNMLRQNIFYTDVVQESYNLPVVFVMKLSGLQYNDSLWDAIKVSIFTIESSLLDSARFRKYGAIAIFDFKDTAFATAIQFTPNLLLPTLPECLFEGVPVKLCTILFINVGSIVRAAFHVGSLLLPLEIRNTIRLSSGSWESITDKVPAQCLPIEYGGTNGTVEENVEPCEAMLMRWRDYMLDDERYGFIDTEQES